MSEAVIVGRNLAVGYRQERGGRENRPIGHRSRRIHRGEFACLLECQRRGQSTLLRTLAGTQPELHGAVTIGGRRCTGWRKALAQRLSVVLTDRLQVGNLTVYELISLGRFPTPGCVDG
ncbi:MAG: hypothetical protein R3E79_16000 [Caldilineaceae bacterium]